MLTMHVPDCMELVEGSLTVPGVVTPDQWRSAFNTWCKKVERGGGALIWRVELQKRQQPHIHFIGYARDFKALGPMASVEGWLDCLRPHLPPEDINRPAAQKRALMWSSRQAEDIDWLAYCTAHATKSKQSQLGWQGKQWGIINRKLFVERPAQKTELTGVQGACLRRWMRHYIQSKVKQKKYRKFVNLGSGSFGRLIKPGVPARLVEWIVANVDQVETRRAGGSKKFYQLRERSVAA